MAQIMTPEKNNSVYLFSPCMSVKPGKRKVEHVDQEMFFDGIKRLYNEDTNEVAMPSSLSSSSSSSSIAIVTCASEARLDSSALPSLTTVAN